MSIATEPRAVLRTIAAGLLAGLAACAGNTDPALNAAPDPAPNLAIFRGADADHDDRVTHEELLVWERARIAEIDADGDGFLSIAEIRRWSEANPGIHLDLPRLERLLRRLYPDRADPAGFPAEVALERYDRRRMTADLDRDGVITRVEAVEAARTDKSRIDLMRLLDEVAPRQDLGAGRS